MRSKKRHQPNRPLFVGPHDIRCRGCGERSDPPLWRVCQTCRAESLAKLARQLEPAFSPPDNQPGRARGVVVLTGDEAFAAIPDDAWQSGPTDIYPCLAATEIVEAYQGDHANHDIMFDIIHPIAEADKRKYRLT